jgi:hypothetical protein
MLLGWAAVRGRRIASFGRAFFLLSIGAAGCAVGVSSPDDVSGALDAEPQGGDATTRRDGGDTLDSAPFDSTASGEGASQQDTGAVASEGGGDDATTDGTAASDSAPNDSAANDSPEPDSAPSDSSTPDVEDAGSPDAGRETGADASPDASTDAGRDAGSDAGITCASHGYSGTLVAFDLSAQPGNESNAPATSTAAGVSSTALARSPAINPASGIGSINASNWATGSAADATRYYTFTVTPASGCSVALSSLALDVRASSTGPRSGDVATSVDAFAMHSPSFAGTITPTVSLSASGSGAIEVRIYGYAAGGSTGTLRIQNTMTLSGSIQ